MTRTVVGFIGDVYFLSRKIFKNLSWAGHFLCEVGPYPLARLSSKLTALGTPLSSQQFIAIV